MLLYRGYSPHVWLVSAGIGDRTIMRERVGCLDLLNAVTERVRPKLHVFGHIHEGRQQRQHALVVVVVAVLIMYL